MHVGWIQLVEFRNYRTLSYHPSPRFNLLIGSNGQGKTNLLEALAFLLTGRSFRTSRLGDLARWGEDSTTVTGEVVRGEAPRPLRRALSRGDDGRWQGAGETCAWARVIAFGWQDLAILNGMPAARRQFIDGVAGRLYPGHIPTLLRYRQVLAQRNLLLRGRPAAGLAARLEPWDAQLAMMGMELVDRRRRAVAMVQTELARIYPALSGEATKAELRYKSELGEATEPAAALEALLRVRGAEVRRGQTLVGPHRDDLTIELDGTDARVFGSRGQQRLLALALRLAEVLPVMGAVGTAPVLLLDDALSELDGRVREHVVREIQGAEQVFLTAPEALDVPGAARWHVQAGGLAAA